MNGSRIEIQNVSHKRRAVLSGIVALFLIGAFTPIFVDVVLAQKARARRTRTAPATRKAPVAGVDYSRFSHATQKHQGACNTCHKAPTDNWKKVRNFPDVADFPGHDACVSCHRQQFFKGAKPVICSGCHSKVSPKDDVRFAFRNPAARGQFLIEFPHDKHQDVIARTFRRLADEEHPRFVRASFTYSVADEKTKHYNNCEICHGPRTTVPAAPPSGWVDSFVPDAAAFKAVPTSHASCFNCHWKSEQPTAENCGGCHKQFSSANANLSVLLSVNPKPPDFVPFFLPELRFSLKFRHAREQHVAECTTCHINITKSSTLRGLKPDVPITACTECHNKDGLRQDVSKELEAIDKQRDFTCAYCHTSEVGRRDPPASHYLIAGREAMKRKDVK